MPDFTSDEIQGLIVRLNAELGRTTDAVMRRGMIRMLEGAATVAGHLATPRPLHCVGPSAWPTEWLTSNVNVDGLLITLGQQVLRGPEGLLVSTGLCRVWFASRWLYGLTCDEARKAVHDFVAEHSPQNAHLFKEG